MHNWEQISAITFHRRSHDGPTKKRMVEVKDRYNGDYIIPMPDVDGQPSMASPMPGLIANGIDGQAMAAASVRPVITSPALDASKESGVRSREYARIRQRALYGMWYQSKVDLLMRRFLRQLIGYGTGCFVVVPDFDKGHPVIELRDALTAYPDPRQGAEVRRPENIAFTFGRSGEYLASRYPKAERLIQRGEDRSQLWDVVEWIDEDHIVLGILGPRDDYLLGTDYGTGRADIGMELARWPNRVGHVPVACSDRVTLDRVAGAMAAVVQNNDLVARMMALDVLAAEKAIFPDRFVIGADGRTPQLLNGPWKDGRSGQTNMLVDVSNIGELNSNPGQMTHSVIDRLESSIRQTGDVHPFYSGMAPGNSLRTGRAISNFGQATIEPRLQETQELAAYALTLVNESLIDASKSYFGSKETKLFSGWSSDIGIIEYTPKVHFETSHNAVNYNYPGQDAQSAGVTSLQLNGGGLISKHTARVRHPYIEDPEGEARMVTEEALEQAVLVSLQQGAAAGSLPVTDLARIKKLVAQGKSIDDAVQQAQREAQERQASEAPPPEEGQVTSPEAQPGLAPPGAGAEQPQSPGTGIRGPSPDMQNLRNTLVALRSR